MITVSNNGQEIVSTNHFDSKYAKNGFLYVTINAGAVRLLVPDLIISQIAEFKTANEVIISRGPFPGQNLSDAYEILFEDNTNEPYSLHLHPDLFDRALGNKDTNKQINFTVWTRSGKHLELPCYFRMVNNLPYLKPYKKRG